MTLQSVGIYISEYRFMQLLLFLSRPTARVSSLAGEPTHETEKCFRSEPVQNAGPTAQSGACRRSRAAGLCWATFSFGYPVLPQVSQEKLLWETEGRNHLQNNCPTFCCCIVRIRKAAKAGIF